MKMSKKISVALLFGGRSAEHEISLASAAAIYKNLDANKFRIHSFFINKAGDWQQVNSPLLTEKELNQGRFCSFIPWEQKAISDFPGADIYFPILHGPYGEDGTIQGLFEMADVPYVGAAVLSSALGMDKAVAKSLFMSHHLPVVKYDIIRERNWRSDPSTILDRIGNEFHLPVYVKPANLGSSIGISKVSQIGNLASALELAFLYDKKILVEQSITGRELECSVLGDAIPRASLPGEIIPHREFYDYRDKYIDGKTGFRIPAQLPLETAEEIQHIAVQAFQAIECSGMARVDFFLEESTDKVYLNEINTIPGFTEISMYPKLWEVSGLTFPQLLEELLKIGLRRHETKKRCLSYE